MCSPLRNGLKSPQYNMYVVFAIIRYIICNHLIYNNTQTFLNSIIVRCQEIHAAIDQLETESCIESHVISALRLFDLD